MFVGYIKNLKGNIMKFAHLADTHLGYRQFGLLEREKDFYEVFDKIIDKLIKILPSLIDNVNSNKISLNYYAVFEELTRKINDSCNKFIPINQHYTNTNDRDIGELIQIITNSDILIETIVILFCIE